MPHDTTARASSSPASGPGRRCPILEGLERDLFGCALAAREVDALEALARDVADLGRVGGGDGNGLVARDRISHG